MDTIIPTSDLIDRLRARLGERGVLTDPADTAPYCEIGGGFITAAPRRCCGRRPSRKSPMPCDCVPSAALRSYRRAAIPAWSAAPRSARMDRRSC